MPVHKMWILRSVPCAGLVHRGLVPVGIRSQDHNRIKVEWSVSIFYYYRIINNLHTYSNKFYAVKMPRGEVVKLVIEQTIIGNLIPLSLSLSFKPGVIPSVGRSPSTVKSFVYIIVEKKRS